MKHQDEDMFLSASDLLRHESDIRRVEVPPLSRDGRPGVVFVRRLSAGDVMEFLEVDPSNQNDAMLRVISRNVVDKDARPIFTADQVDKLRDLRMDVFNILSTAISSELKSEGDNAKVASGVVDGVASPSLSPVS